MVTRRLEELPKDLDRKISRDFNNLLVSIQEDLPKNSPVWTGFFASSWKIQATPIAATDRAENHLPWKAIKYERSLDFFTRRAAGPPFQIQERPRNPRIEPRFSIGEDKRIFNYKKPVYIGNKAIYAAYVLESDDLQKYIQGKLGNRVKEKMGDNNKVKFGEAFETKGFGRSKPTTIQRF